MTHDEPTTTMPADAAPADPASATVTESEATTKACHRCGRELPLDARVCFACGQKLYRQCFCGQSFPADLSTCPACGTDWVKSVRVRRRSRSEKIKPRTMLRRAGLGAALALIVAGVANVVVTALAQRATPDGIVPDDLGARLLYAWETLASSLVKLSGTLLGGLLPTLAIAVVGAGIGILIYWLPIKLGRTSRSSRHNRVRRRRSHQ